MFRFVSRCAPRVPALHRPFSSSSSPNWQLSAWLNSVRRHGHLFATINPLNAIKKEQHNASLIDPATFGLDPSTQLEYNDEVMTVGELQQRLQQVYMADIAAETQHVENNEERDWLNARLESPRVELSPSEKKNLFSLLYQSEIFDHFMGKKFTSFKRYGLEGNEVTIPALSTMLGAAAANNYQSVVVGMPHRGRFNILVGLLEYKARGLFAKIKGHNIIHSSIGGIDDVASHIAQSVTTNKFGKSLSVSLLHNPSHLEAINPVALGKARAKQDASLKTLSLQLHGDSAFAGQGVVTESLQMAYLPGFSVGGTVHVITNNQLGFTTSLNRSGRYSSDVVKMISAPVLHVNADEPEAVIHAAKIVVDYHAQFGKDIVLDIVGYRKHGHNEVDEPAFTQPLMYQDIRSRASVVAKYKQQLGSLLPEEFVQRIEARAVAYLEAELKEAEKYHGSTTEHFQGNWQGYLPPKHCHDVVATGVPANELVQIGKDSVRLPANFTIHPRLQKGHVDARLQALEKSQLDWSTAEALAFGSLLKQGHNVRLCGQDVERGTFSQRHHVLTDQKTDEKYSPLAQAGYAGKLYTINSLLSEEAVLGFEYGYSWESPKNLIVWEAQFGDFFNGAQIMIDTFVSSGESKWARASGMVILLPHGYDGAGPEHSSARIERWLQLTDAPEQPKQHNVNFIVANPTTPAQYFHLLRRQQLRPYRKPLVVIGPKTLLRHEKAVSPLAELSNGAFKPVLTDDAVAPKDVKTLVFVSGKAYYDLALEREKKQRKDIAFVRVEELCPFPFEQLKAELSKFSHAKNLVWFQEESANSGAWSWVEPRFRSLLHSMGSRQHMAYVGRDACPAPAVGSGVEHKREVEKLMKDMFAY